MKRVVLIMAVLLGAASAYAKYNVDAVSADTTMGKVSMLWYISSGKEVAEFSAKPEYGYLFNVWMTKDGTIFSYDATFRYDVYNDITLIAFFKKDTFNISTSAVIPNHAELEPSEYVKITAPESALYKDTVTLSAECEEGFEFVGWVSTANPSDTLKRREISVVVEADCDYVAVARHKQYKVEVGTAPTTWPVTFFQENADGIYYYGDTVVVSVSDTTGMDRWDYKVGDKWMQYSDPSFSIHVKGIKKDYHFAALFSGKPPVSAEEAFDNVSELQKPYKTIINNRVVIVVGDRKYNLLGVEVK